MPAMPHPRAIDIIRDEHRSFAAVLEGLLHVCGEIRSARGRPNFRLIAAMLDYIEAFPEKLHHPKEDAYVYARLREVLPESAAMLDDLTAEHVRGRAMIAGLTGALTRYRDSEPGAAEAFASALQRYADFHWAHMRKEEELALPLALATLTPDDWRAIDAAFASNADPLVGLPATKASRELFRRVLNLAPPPLGIGRPRR
jgi:branched-chain amino acid transport system ATP-binding protein